MTITVNNINQAPTADSGPDQTVNEGASVTLNGRGSSDPDTCPLPDADSAGTCLTYTWTKTAGPAVTLDLTDPSKPTFTAPSVGAGGGTLTFSLVVKDSANANSTNANSVTITVNNINQAPSITSVSVTDTDSPDSVAILSDITFSVDWSDPDAGDQVRAHICKASGIGAGGCTAGTWTSSALSSTDPATATYTTVVADCLNSASCSKNYYAYVCDGGGLCSAATSGTFTITNSAPETYIDSCPSVKNSGGASPNCAHVAGDLTAAGGPYKTRSTSASFTFSGTDTESGAVGAFECSLDGAAFVVCNSGSATYAGPLSLGAHNFKVKAKDTSGLVDSTPANFDWTIEANQSPAIDSMQNTFLGYDSFLGNKASFSFTASDPDSDSIDHFECSSDNGVTGFNCGNTGTVNYINLAPGAYRFTVRAVDNQSPPGVGNWYQPSFNWTAIVQSTDIDFNAGTFSSTQVYGAGTPAAVVLQIMPGVVSQQIAIGDASCALKTDGIMSCWGTNTSGQLGDNTTTSKSLPVQVLGVGGAGVLADVSAIDTESVNTCALKTDGTVYCWGDNLYGQVGDGTTTDRNTPVQVRGVGGAGFLTNISQISVGYAVACAVKTDKTAYCWGLNGVGQLGDGTTTDRNTPVQVRGVGGAGSLADVLQISAGANHTCALKNDGTVYCWGSNTFGQLGDGTNTSRNTPVQVKGVLGAGSLTNISQISATGNETCALKNDGTVYCWGHNSSGQLGDGTTTNRNTPVQVKGVLGAGFLTGVSQISDGYGHVCAVKNDGTAYCWGTNTDAQLGQNDFVQRNTPAQVRVSGAGFLTGVSQISAGSGYTCALRIDGSVYCGGKNDKGQLGQNNTISPLTPFWRVLGVGGVGWFSTSAYSPFGTFTSAVIDMNSNPTFQNANYSTTMMAGTSVTIDVRAGNTAVPDATWITLTNVSNGGSLNALNGNRYIQYIVNLSTTNTSLTPSFNDIQIWYH